MIDVTLPPLLFIGGAICRPVAGFHRCIVPFLNPPATSVVDPKVESIDDADDTAALCVSTKDACIYVLLTEIGFSLASQPSDLLVSSDSHALLLEILLSSEAKIDFDTHYGLPAPSQMVVVHAYTDDMDDQILAEL